MQKRNPKLSKLQRVNSLPEFYKKKQVQRQQRPPLIGRIPHEDYQFVLKRNLEESEEVNCEQKDLSVRVNMAPMLRGGCLFNIYPQVLKPGPVGAFDLDFDVDVKDIDGQQRAIRNERKQVRIKQQVQFQKLFYQPVRKHNTCNVCKVYYDDQFEHIKSDTHKRNIKMSFANKYILDLSIMFQSQQDSANPSHSNYKNHFLNSEQFSEIQSSSNQANRPFENEGENFQEQTQHKVQQKDQILPKRTKLQVKIIKRLTKNAKKKSLKAKDSKSLEKRKEQIREKICLTFKKLKQEKGNVSAQQVQKTDPSKMVPKRYQEDISQSAKEAVKTLEKLEKRKRRQKVFIVINSD